RSRSNEARLDAELEPPGRQFGKTASGSRSEGRTIVAADRQRQAILAKSLFKTGANALRGGSHNPQLDQKAAVAVGHRQRIDPPLVAGTKPALEVHAPFMVRRCHRRAWPPL